LFNEAAALNCSVLDVLDSWGERGASRDDLIAKCQAIAQENAAIDREEMERQREKSETAARGPKAPRKR